MAGSVKVGASLAATLTAPEDGAVAVTGSLAATLTVPEAGAVGVTASLAATLASDSDRVQWVAAGAFITGTGTGVTPAIPTEAITGDTLVALVRCEVAGTMTASTGWTKLYEDTATRIFWRTHTAGDPNPTFSVTGTNGYQARISAFRGASLTNPFKYGAEAATTGTGTTVTAPAVALAPGNGLALQFYSHGGGTTGLGYPSGGFAQWRDKSATDGGGSLMLATRSAYTGGVVSAATATEASAPWTGVTAGLYADLGGPASGLSGTGRITADGISGSLLEPRGLGAVRLGTGVYEAYVADRGGYPLLGSVGRVESGSWERRRDEMSSANVKVANPGTSARSVLADVRAGRHELVIFRNGQRVWEGPITRPVYERDKVELHAQDVLWYASRLPLTESFDNTGAPTNALDLMRTILQLGFGDGATDPYRFNVGQYLTVLNSTDDARTVARLERYSMSLLEILEKFADDGGVDYTVVGRRVLVFDAHLHSHVLPRMTDEHFEAGLVVSEYASGLAIQDITSNGEGSAVIAKAPQEWLDYYGPLSLIRPAEGEPVEDAPEIVEERSGGKYPAPLLVYLPENTGLLPSAPLDIQDLIPGARIPLRSTGTCRTVETWQKLNGVSVSWDNSGEKVAVSMAEAPAKMGSLV